MSYGNDLHHSPQRLLLAAKAALLMLDNAQHVLWGLFGDELLAISDESEQEILEYLTMAFSNEAYPSDRSLATPCDDDEDDRPF
jgi:hypothetical protein